MSSESLSDLLQDREFWLSFIKDYQLSPVLWKTTNLPSNKRLRDMALLSLTKKVRSRWPEANIEFTKQRISNFRRTFLNEYEKVEQAKKSNKTYTPSLYYYKHMKFLKGEDLDGSDDTPEPDKKLLQSVSEAELITKEKRSQASTKTEVPYTEEKPLKRIRLIPIKRKDAVANIVFVNEKDNDTVVTEEESMVIEPKSEGDFSIVQVSPEFVKTATEYGSNQVEPSSAEDEFDEIAKRVATHFRKMDAEQCLFAEKLIFDVCISGRLKHLTANTSITNS